MYAVATDSSDRYAPVEYFQVLAGGPDPIINLALFAAGSTAGHPRTGLDARAGQAYFLGPAQEVPAAVALVPGPGDHGQCGFWEIDRQLMPGIYGVQLPLYLRSRGYTHVYLQFAGTRPHYLSLHGVAYDPYDSFALGLASWIRSTCHEHLASGLRRSMPAALTPLLVP